MPESAVTITVHATAEGVELRAAGAGAEPVVLRLARDVGLTLADQITMACEERRLAAA